MSSEQNKKVKGWVVLTEGKMEPFQFSYHGDEQYEVFPTKGEGLLWTGGAPEMQVVPCTISYSLPITNRKRKV